MRSLGFNIFKIFYKGICIAQLSPRATTILFGLVGSTMAIAAAGARNIPNPHISTETVCFITTARGLTTHTLGQEYRALHDGTISYCGAGRFSLFDSLSF